MFMDAVGSTSLGESTDPESLRRVMTRYFEEIRAIVERHGGTVEKYIGDAVMAVFGVPIVHEDDALRAVRAAFEIRSQLELVSAELQEQRGSSVAWRTGVNTGEVVAGDAGAGQRFVTGDAVNVAARLEQAANAGEILLGSDTYGLVRDRVTIEPTEPITAKGKSELLIALPPIGHLRPGSDAFWRFETRVADDRPSTSATPALGGVRTGDRGAGRLPVHDPGLGRRREVAARCGVPGRLGRRGSGAPRQVSVVRRGHHVLANNGSHSTGCRARRRGRRRDDPAQVGRVGHG